MIKFLVFLVFFCNLGNCLYSQGEDSVKYRYTNLTIYRYGNHFLKGSERLTFKDLSQEFSMSELGLVSYTKSRKYRTTSYVFRYASMLMGFACIGVAANNGNKNTVLYLLGGQLVFGFGASKYGKLSTQSLDRAIWLRNKDYLFPGR